MTLRSTFLACAICAFGLASAANAGDAAVFLLATADCSKAAADAAAETGGRVLTVSSRSQNGQVVCVVTVIVPANDGKRPRKQTVVFPQ